MSKFTDAVKATLKALFETGDVPDGADFEDWFDRIQEGIQEHEHKASGGAGSGTGDAAKIVDTDPQLDGDLDGQNHKIQWLAKIVGVEWNQGTDSWSEV